MVLLPISIPYTVEIKTSLWRLDIQYVYNKKKNMYLQKMNEVY